MERLRRLLPSINGRLIFLYRREVELILRESPKSVALAKVIYWIDGHAHFSLIGFRTHSGTFDRPCAAFCAGHRH
jgi:hypothetical protein